MSTPLMESMAGLSKLTALILGMLVDSPDSSLQEAGEALDVYRQMAQLVEQDWGRSKLSIVVNDEEIGKLLFVTTPVRHMLTCRISALHQRPNEDCLVALENTAI